MKNSNIQTDCLSKHKFQTEDLVWAKLRGYAWWPAKILGQSNKGLYYSVQFYGDGKTNDKMKIEQLKPFDESTQKIATLCNYKDFKLAVEEANKILKERQGKKVYKKARKSQIKEEEDKKYEPIKVTKKIKLKEEKEKDKSHDDLNNSSQISKTLADEEGSKTNKFINKKRNRSLNNSEVEDINKNINELGNSILRKSEISITNSTPEEDIKSDINKKENENEQIINPMPKESDLILEIKRIFLPNFKSDVERMRNSYLETKINLDSLIKTIEYYNPSIQTGDTTLKDEVYSELVESLLIFTDLTYEEKCLNKLIDLIAESLRVDTQGLDGYAKKLPLIAEKLKARKEAATMEPYYKESVEQNKTIKKSKYHRFSEFYDYTKSLLTDNFALNLDEFSTLDGFCDNFIFGDYLLDSNNKLESQFKSHLNIETRYDAMGHLLKEFRTILMKFSFQESFIPRFCSFIELKSKEKFPLESQEGDYSTLIKHILQDAKGYMLFKLLSTADTGYFYVGKKSVERAAQKISLMKFDPLINQHVLFVETKMKSRKR